VRVVLALAVTFLESSAGCCRGQHFLKGALLRQQGCHPITCPHLIRSCLSDDACSATRSLLISAVQHLASLRPSLGMHTPTTNSSALLTCSPQPHRAHKRRRQPVGVDEIGAVGVQVGASAGIDHKTLQNLGLSQQGPLCRAVDCPRICAGCICALCGSGHPHSLAGNRGVGRVDEGDGRARGVHW
jgi:hypothetical protein